jgi:heat shock protein HslJ
MMKKKFFAPLIAGLSLLMIVFLIGCTPAPAAPGGAGAADPQKLLIPRWFLSELTLNGQKVEIPAGQQKMTLQFEEGGKVGGTGGCNSFGGEYKAGTDGKVTFGQLASTLMACADGMQQESAYLEALSKVQQYQVAEGKLTLSSTDGQTTLVFAMPPK